MFTDMDYDLEEDKLGIPTVPGTVCLKKDANNLIGISIGGGAQYCPCLYIVQVFDNTPAALEGTLAAGDEITGVNGKPVKGKTKVEVAKMIQAVQGEATIHYNKLQADPKQGKSLDIVLKKVKHRLVENMSSGTADALGLSRAILCNDGLVKRLEELEKTAELYKGLMEHTKRLLRAFFELSQTHRAFGDVFSVIGVREPQAAASEAFVKFADAHRNIEKYGIQLLKTIKPMLHDLNTYLHKAIPDTKLTIRKYLDVKFEYLSYCLKVKEMDDEEYSSIAMGEPLYRVSTGNYEYRLVLRCRQEARARFAKMRKDVLEKIELLDQKHGLSFFTYNSSCVRTKTWRMPFSTLTFRCIKSEMTVEMCGPPRQVHSWHTHISSALEPLATLREQHIHDQNQNQPDQPWTHQSQCCMGGHSATTI
uniref:PRKCA-binding protein n=1 Tax=Sphaeramia orbicularis TaxID=375764 RepID=A0A672ZPU4_9TELE